jgi:hypothetical protein
MEITQETGNLISSEKVEGAIVYNAAGEELGSIHHLMLNKTAGTVAHAIMSFGGFLGIGNQYHPLPWALLKYDTEKGGYVVNLDKSQLQGAPAYPAEDEPIWDDPAYEARINDFWGTERPYTPPVLAPDFPEVPQNPGSKLQPTPDASPSSSLKPV